MVQLFGSPQTIQATGVMLSSGVDGEGSALFGYEHMTATIMYSKISSSHLSSEIQAFVALIQEDNRNQVDQWLEQSRETVSIMENMRKQMGVIYPADAAY